ncbi:MAG TPA: TlpA disulfide reductase family protein [Edaphobacter sp.]
MKLFAGILLLAMSAFAQSANHISIDGTWEGTATVRGQQVPIKLQISGPVSDLKAALLNGPEQSAGSSATFSDDHLVVTFNYYARTLDAKLEDGKLAGTFGLASAAASARYPFVLHRAADSVATLTGPDIRGDWEIAVASAKGESAWLLRVQPVAKQYGVHAVIQRIDGDTGSLYGGWDGTAYKVGRFTAAGPALYSLMPKSDGTLLVSNLLATEAQRAQAVDLVARRPAEARKENLATPTESTQQTTVKDPSAPFAFSFPDLTGKLVSNSDAQFQGKVVIVAIGGSWCPNCHDEAPFLESLYKQYHAKGLEIVNLSFEEDDQLKDPQRLRAFIARYGITYPVLIAGTPDQLQEKIPQGERLNCWPTSFFLGRDGRVKEVHAGFAGPANPEGHRELEHEVTALVTKLLAETATAQSASQ